VMRKEVVWVVMMTSLVVERFGLDPRPGGPARTSVSNICSNAQHVKHWLRAILAGTTDTV